MKLAQNNDSDSVGKVLRHILTAPARKREAALAAAVHALQEQNPGLLLVNQAEAARMLAVSKTTVWRLTKSGALLPVRVLGAVRYSVEQLRKLASNETVVA